jgi:hypothetical protein
MSKYHISTRHLIVRQHTVNPKGLRLKVQRPPSSIEKVTSFLALLLLMSSQVSGFTFHVVTTYHLLDKAFKAQSEPAEYVIKNRSESDVSR